LAKLGRKDAGEHRMHLVGMSGKEISILIHTVDVMDRVVPGGLLMASKDWPDLIVSEEDAWRINEILLTGGRPRRITSRAVPARE
jgi:hypothetical protein